MICDSSSEDFAQTVTRLHKVLPSQFIESALVLRHSPAPFGRLMQYLIAKMWFEPDSCGLEITPELRRELAVLEENDRSCRRLELFVRALRSRGPRPPGLGDVVFRTFHGLLCDRPDGPCLLRQLRTVARDEVASVIALRKKYAPRARGARAVVAASRGNMKVFLRFVPRLHKADLAYLAEAAAENNWTTAFEHIVTTGLIKKLGKDCLSEIANVAFRSQPIETLKILLDGLDVNYFPRRELTLLESAVSHDREDVVRLLVSKGATVNIPTYLGDYPLHRAQHQGVCRALIEAGADIECKNPEGGTPLLAATEMRRAEVVACLLDYGADSSVRDREGRNIFEIASSHEDVATLEVIQSRELFAEQIMDYWMMKSERQ